MTHLNIIETFYGDRTAKRSGIPLINHITEGLTILNHLDAKQVVKDGWCLHPIVQHDDDLKREIFDHRMTGADTSAVILAMEYRHVANSYLSPRRELLTRMELVRLMDTLALNLSQNKMLWQMLVADKIQNYKALIWQDEGTYENFEVLNEYFLDWIFQILMLSQEQYREMIDLIKE